MRDFSSPRDSRFASCALVFAAFGFVSAGCGGNATNGVDGTDDDGGGVGSSSGSSLGPVPVPVSGGGSGDSSGSANGSSGAAASGTPDTGGNPRDRRDAGTITFPFEDGGFTFPTRDGGIFIPIGDGGIVIPIRPADDGGIIFRFPDAGRPVRSDDAGTRPARDTDAAAATCAELSTCCDTLAGNQKTLCKDLVTASDESICSDAFTTYRCR